VNYRHHFHAGNFADVMKHVLLVRLLRALQKKEKGLLCLDTHAGRGRYDLEAAAQGDSLARKPEWPDGIGRLWNRAAADLPESVADYVALVREYDRRHGNLETTPRFYPGSPWIAQMLARPIDRLALCEKPPPECDALRAEFSAARNASVHEMDGYVAMRAMLPPPERRALVLVDPPYEAQDEFAQVVAGLRGGLARFPTGVFAVWYPLTSRARLDDFFAELRALAPPPTLACELAIAGDGAPMKMRGCGVVVINPPWKFADEANPVLAFLARTLAQAPGADSRVDWIVPER
jgi:23S rRNA (adenine2030-N6)-methyltransferase